MSRPSKEDWVCSDPKCKNVNFAKRERCNRCDKPRKHGPSSKGGSEVGKQLAEKSKGLFSPDDWICKTCGNVNWARRNTCNVCNAPKIDVQGERTGYGGGFMERDEVVEYREHRDSDDEFDEFGRKKKNFRRGQNDHLTSSSNHDSSDSSNHNHNLQESHNSVGRDQMDDKANEVDEDDDEDEEESGDDADLSKYDIWGTEDDEDVTKKSAATNKKSHSRSAASSSSDSDSDSDSSSSSSASSSSSSHASQSDSESSSESSSKREDQQPSGKRAHPNNNSNNGDVHSDSGNSTPVNQKRKRRTDANDHGQRDRSRFGFRAEGQSLSNMTTLRVLFILYICYLWNRVFYF